MDVRSRSLAEELIHRGENCHLCLDQDDHEQMVCSRLTDSPAMSSGISSMKSVIVFYKFPFLGVVECHAKIVVFCGSWEPHRMFPLVGPCIDVIVGGPFCVGGIVAVPCIVTRSWFAVHSCSVHSCNLTCVCVAICDPDGSSSSSSDGSSL